MNNLKNTICYIARPIEYSDNNNWEEEQLTDFLMSKQVDVINPKKIKFKGISEIINRKKMFKENNFEEIRRQMKIIVRKDLRSVDISSFLIAYLPEGVKTVGVIHEIIESDKQKKPTLIYCPQGINKIPAWFFGILPIQYMFDDISKLYEYLENIDTKENDDDRWQFILNYRDSIENNF